MSRKVEIAIAFATLLVALGAWLFPTPTFQPGGGPNPVAAGESWYKKLMPAKTLYVTGAGVRVEVLKGESGAEFRGGEVSEAGGESKIYVPLGQRLSLDISGTGALVVVESELMPYIQVSNHGTGAAVIER